MWTTEEGSWSSFQQAQSLSAFRPEHTLRDAIVMNVKSLLGLPHCDCLCCLILAAAHHTESSEPTVQQSGSNHSISLSKINPQSLNPVKYYAQLSSILRHLQHAAKGRCCETSWTRRINDNWKCWKLRAQHSLATPKAHSASAAPCPFGNNYNCWMFHRSRRYTVDS